MQTETQGRNAGLYGRESQADDQSIRDQLAGGRRAAAELGWTVVDEYHDPLSGSRFAHKHREMWARLLADIESGRINALIIKDASRADRNPETWFPFLSLCRRLGVLIYSVADDHIYNVRKRRDWKTLADEGVRNADESEKISERQVIAHDDAYRAGRPSGGDCPYGYDRIRTPKPNNPKKYDVKQVENPEAAEVVRWIFKEIAAGTPLRTVLKSLNRRGVLSPRGVEGWQHGRVRGIISNPVYIGMRRHNGSPWVKGNWPALVDEETFHAAQRVLETNRAEREGDRPARLEHMLAGVIKCACDNPAHEHPGGVCGGDVSGRGAVAGRSAKYGCREYGCAFVLAAAADEYIFDVMMEKFADPSYVPALLRRAATSSEDAARAGVELERLLARKREWQARLESEEDSDVEDSILGKIRSINEKIKSAQRQLSEVSVPTELRVLFGDSLSWDADSLALTIPTQPPKAEDKPSFDEFVRGFDLVRRFAALSVPARRNLIRSLMEIKLYPSGRGKVLPTEQRITYRFR
jgi:DNA invertase Pin-like site-specific DNA recombinase